MGGEGVFELPTDPVLRAAAIVLEEAGHAGFVFDSDWNVVHASDELQLLWADASGGDRAAFPVGVHLFSTAMIRASQAWKFGPNTVEFWRGFLREVGGVILADTPGGHEQLREQVDPALRDLVDELAPEPATVSWVPFVGAGVGEARSAPMMITRLRDTHGALCGSVLIGKPAVGMSTVIGMAHGRDIPHLERMERLTRAGRRSAAILFADLEGSSSLSRRLSTSRYFMLGRRLVRAADRSVVEAGGLAGRHVGDGVVAFFPSETFTSESAAARACIESARSLRSSVAQVAADTGLDPDEVTLRFGLHWGAALYIGRITTLARTEVTALGDEVNESARIEACATGGRTLASKSLVERLEQDDAAALGLDPEGMVYTALAELATATEKARRDAPAVAVCEV
jgi:class 3 adenylate cyclase